MHQTPACMLARTLRTVRILQSKRYGQCPYRETTLIESCHTVGFFGTVRGAAPWSMQEGSPGLVGAAAVVIPGANQNKVCETSLRNVKCVVQVDIGIRYCIITDTSHPYHSRQRAPVSSLEDAAKLRREQGDGKFDGSNPIRRSDAAIFVLGADRFSGSVKCRGAR